MLYCKTTATDWIDALHLESKGGSCVATSERVCDIEEPYLTWAQRAERYAAAVDAYYAAEARS